jgi:hypothetical protein
MRQRTVFDAFVVGCIVAFLQSVECWPDFARGSTE